MKKETLFILLLSSTINANGVVMAPIISYLLSDATSTDCNDTADNDSDRILNCYETNTGIYIDETDTGTDPENPDTDGDKIPDGDEVLGTLAGLDLPAMGVSPLKKNILLEYDWFDDSLDCAAHSHRPTLAQITAVTTAFANSPVTNPDGTTGITMIHDYGQGGAFTNGNLINDADGVLVGGVSNTEFLNHKTANFDNNRNGYFHYVVLAHRYNTTSSSSGQAELNGDDLIVSIQCYVNYTSVVANTIMHELGHNLNLRHGGGEDTNRKPNYNSVMNYKYQFPGVDTDCDSTGDGLLNYSVGDRIELNETSLNENNGVCNSVAIDWNDNGIIENFITYNVNVNYDGDSEISILNDYNDWANIVFTGVGDSDGMAVNAEPEIIECNNSPSHIH